MTHDKKLKKGKAVRAAKVAGLLAFLLVLGVSAAEAQTQDSTINGFSTLTGTQDGISVTIGGTYLTNEEDADEPTVRLGVQQEQMIENHYVEYGNEGEAHVRTPVRGFFTNYPAGTIIPEGIYDSTGYHALHYNYSSYNYDSLTTLLLTVWPIYEYYDTLYLDSTELIQMNTPPLDPRVEATLNKRFHAGENISYFLTIHGGDSIIHFIVRTCGGATKDIDGNIYQSVFVGPYCWTKSNLRATHYSKTGAPAEHMIYRSNDHPDTVANLATYGRLYTWYAAVNLPLGSDRRPDTTVHGGFVTGICPIGWHIPEKENIEELYSHTSYDLMTTTGWIEPGGTNLTGFSALPAGVYNPVTGRFENLLNETHYYSVESHDVYSAMICSIVFGCEKVLIDESKLKYYGLSVRCVKDQIYDDEGNVIAD